MSLFRFLAPNGMHQTAAQYDDREWKRSLRDSEKVFEGVRMAIHRTLLNNVNNILVPVNPQPRDDSNKTYVTSAWIQFNEEVDRVVEYLNGEKQQQPGPKGMILPSGKPTTPFRLFDLPQEIQDKIFDYAYGVQSCSTMLCKALLQSLLLQMRIRPFPKHKVDEWMISKRYLRSAGQAWMKSQSFSCHPRPTHMLACVVFISHRTGLYMDYGVNATIAYIPKSWTLDHQTLLKCRSLKSLILRVRYNVFSAILSKKPWQDLFTDDDLKAVLRNSLPLPPGLQQLYIVPETSNKVLKMDNPMAKTAPDAPPGRVPARVFATNVSALERMAREMFLLETHATDGPSGADSATRQHTKSGKIYSGSKVSYP